MGDKSLPRIGQVLFAFEIQSGYVIDLNGIPFPVERRDEVNGYTLVSRYPEVYPGYVGSWVTVPGPCVLLGFFNPELPA